MNQLHLDSRQRRILNHAVFRLLNLLEEEGIPFSENQKENLLIACIFQLAYDYMNPWVANKLLHEEDKTCQTVWDEAFRAAEMKHAEEKGLQ